MERDEAMRRLRATDPAGYSELQQIMDAGDPLPAAARPNEPRPEDQPPTDPTSSPAGSGHLPFDGQPPVDLSCAGGGSGDPTPTAASNQSSADADSSTVSRPLVGDDPPHVGPGPSGSGPAVDDQLSDGLGGLMLGPQGCAGQS